MAILSHAAAQQFIAEYGYWGIGVIVGIESMGIPLPGETVLVAGAIYAAMYPELNIMWVVAAAIVGSIVGDNIGYSIGRRYGYPLLLRHGPKINVTEDRIKVGQYLFKRYGGLIVFTGRFIALLRILAAFLAGVNKMPWWRFLIANAAGAILWASVFGFGGYAFGELLSQTHAKWAPFIAGGAIVAFFTVGVLLHRYERTLVTAARKALPGPLDAPVR